MSQFMLLKYHDKLKKIQDVTLSYDNQELASKAAMQFANDENLVQILYKQKTIDDLCLAAQSKLSINPKFEQTEIFGMLHMLLNLGIEFWFWYGDDYLDLEAISDIELLMSEVKNAITEAQCEIYLHWIPAK